MVSYFVHVSIKRGVTLTKGEILSEIQLLYSFMKYDYEKLISPSFREFYELSIDI